MILDVTGPSLRLDEARFRDKVLGCWIGKNAGGTLGEPLEEKFGREEPFRVDWYPELPEGGIPNDDLELQLVWLQALQERGPGITARDLAEYWLDCVAYNFDEYGLGKANLQKGLLPPVSGWHNNWFKNCMGSPIRSEIWACIAPGAPKIAAWYAYQDAICDHGGGESVYGEVFNAVLESSAFVLADRFRLIEIGLSAIPRECETARSIRRAVELYRSGAEWEAARNALKDEFFHPLAQYAPLNLGFQTVGWLYGDDFGDAICKAVNCGWDTDCTGATVGAILGIIHGANGLPPKWTEPLGDEISTNIGSGGIRNLTAPTDINELTNQVCDQARRVLRYWDAPVEITTTSHANHNESVPGDLDFGLDPTWIQDRRPSAIDWDLHSVEVSLNYRESAAIHGDRSSRFDLDITNSRHEPVGLRVRTEPPEGWQVEPEGIVSVKLEPQASTSLPFTLATAGGPIRDSNLGTVRLDVEGRPQPCRIPLVYLGGSKWLVSPLQEGSTLEDRGEIEEVGVLESPPESWSVLWRGENDLLAEELFQGKSGSIHLLHFVQAGAAKNVIVGVSNTHRMALWLNGRLINKTETPTPMRPNQGNGDGDGTNYVRTVLREGWNQFLVKLERSQAPLQAHFTIGGIEERPKNIGSTVLGLTRSQFPWE